MRVEEEHIVSFGIVNPLQLAKIFIIPNAGSE